MVSIGSMETFPNYLFTPAQRESYDPLLDDHVRLMHAQRVIVDIHTCKLTNINRCTEVTFETTFAAHRVGSIYLSISRILGLAYANWQGRVVDLISSARLVLGADMTRRPRSRELQERVVSPPPLQPAEIAGVFHRQTAK